MKPKKWDKIVWDWAWKQEYILVDSIKSIETDDWGYIKLINRKYAPTWPLRIPTEEELNTKEFLTK
jgi:hypothetical protein